MQRRIPRRVTEGQNARVFIAKDLAYSTEATFGDFVDNAVDGEVGIFLYTSAMNSEEEATIRTTLLTAADVYFVAQKQIGEESLVKKTSPCSFGDLLTKHKEDFCNPVLQISAIGYDGTSGDISDGIVSVDINDIFELGVIETTEGHQPYPTWSYQYTARANDAIEDAVSNLMAQINDPQTLTNKENESLVIAEMLGTGTAQGGVYTAAVTNGSANVTTSGAHGLLANEFVEIAGVVYKIKSVPTTTTMILYSLYVGVTNATAASDGISVFTATGLRLTAIETQTTFSITLKEEFRDVTSSLVTPFKYGSGHLEHLVNLEYEGQIFDGTTTVNAEFQEKWGKQEDYRNSTLAYEIMQIDNLKGAESKALRNSNDTQISHNVIAAPITSGASAPYSNAAASPLATIKTVLGL